MKLLVTLTAVALGGAAGALGRYALSELVRTLTTLPAYAGTLLANLLGCFAIGLAFAHLEAADRPTWLHALLITGLLGAFTTFSTFSLEAMHLIHDRKLGELAAYVAASIAIGLVAVKLGLHLAAAYHQSS